MFFKDEKAQGALEYLLIIGGAIVLAAIVIAVIINITSKTKDTANTQYSDFNNLISDVN
ncbi:MAG: class III signal peptide-containing protein [Candidatus Diapherotrites archaeon CG08_land_8_20_14_0_20_30_16]|nr:MAG: class III signal peptide-containing protein [Candidatus Diapherotrites archaeon CG08_land_8_20_14_0_20_30_16]